MTSSVFDDTAVFGGLAALELSVVPNLNKFLVSLNTGDDDDEDDDDVIPTLLTSSLSSLTSVSRLAGLMSS